MGFIVAITHKDHKGPILYPWISWPPGRDVDRDVDMWVTGGRHPFLARCGAFWGEKMTVSNLQNDQQIIKFDAKMGGNHEFWRMTVPYEKNPAYFLGGWVHDFCIWWNRCIHKPGSEPPKTLTWLVFSKRDLLRLHSVDFQRSRLEEAGCWCCLVLKWNPLWIQGSAAISHARKGCNLGAKVSSLEVLGSIGISSKNWWLGLVVGKSVVF